VVKIITK